MDAITRRQASVQRSHAWARARERYGLYLCQSLYDELRATIRFGAAEHRAGRPCAAARVLGSQEGGRVLILKVWFLDEHVLLAWDQLTLEVRTFLPPRSRHVKGISVEAA